MVLELLVPILLVGLVNGRLPANNLRGIPGNGRLRRQAARSYTAMHMMSMRKRGVSLALFESAIRRTYRPIHAQWLAWNTLPRGQAAFPGTSNHGWGLAVDLMTFVQRAAIDAIGAAFGWAKRWSDAQHEWWHIKYRFGVWTPPPPVPRTLRAGTSGDAVKRLQRILRRRGFTNVPRRGKPGYGRMGRTTVNAVKFVQKSHKMKRDGVVGPNTWQVLLRR